MSRIMASTSKALFSTAVRPASILAMSSTSLMRPSRCSPLRLMISSVWRTFAGTEVSCRMR